MYGAVTHPFLWVLLSTIALLLTAESASGQSLVCRTIRRGDTASAIAQHLTGRASSRYQPWFRVVIDPASSAVFPKHRYDRIPAGWQACVPAAYAIHRTPSIAALPVPAAPAPFPPRDMARELALLCLSAAAIGSAIGLGLESVERIGMKRRALKREMQRFGEVFVTSFEQSLMIDGMAAPVRARLRCVPGDRRMDILIAPAPGRRYPNLVDHRCNVEYDVDRITRGLTHFAFVPKPLYAEGQWVVIPFRFEPGLKTGALV